MNYIKQLEARNEDLLKQIDDINKWAMDMQRYLHSDKFKGFENDYIQVSTDLATWMFELRLKIRG